MRRFRRRKARPIWFPPLGSPFTIGDDTTVFGGVTFNVTVAGQGAIVFTEIPLTFDFGQESILADAQNPDRLPTLSDLTQSAWRLRRVVGTIFATFHVPNSGVQDPQQTGIPSCAFAAGLMVRKVNEFTTAQTNVDVWNRDDYDDPWIWRRSWILGQDARFLRYRDPLVTNLSMEQVPATADVSPGGLDIFAAFSRFPNTTAHYGGENNGYVDQKTNRIIGPEDRLFLHLATKALPIQPEPLFTTDSNVFGMFDFRYLGYNARATNRRNASR